MSVIINLKELFATDSQVEVSNKINFNFNQLLALGVGQTGPIGQQGPQGPAGPIGPIGPKGPSGSVIYGTVPAIAAPSAPIGAPSTISIGDILITSDRILKKVATSPTNIYGWEIVSDFNTLVQAALGSNVSPYVRLGSTSRIVKPKVTAGIDLTNSATSTDPNYSTPGLGSNYQTVLYNFNELRTNSLVNNAGTIQIKSNSSGTVSIFANVLLGSGSPPSTYGVDLTNNTITTASAHGLSTGDFITYSTEGGTAIGGLSNNSGYYVKQISTTEFALCDTYANALTGSPVVDLTSLGTLSSGAAHKLITYPPGVDLIFPQSSNLSLYSFFNSSADPAKEFATTAKGYRSQLELGSLDTLQTAYNGITAQNFVISPSFENLRIRKYRIGSFTIAGGSAANPGNYMLRSEYDLSSSGSELPESFSPRRNSEQVWKINKAGASQNDGRTVEMKLTNGFVLSNTESTAATAGVSVDGLFFKRGANFGATLNPDYFAIGFDPSFIAGGQSKVKIATNGVAVFEIVAPNVTLTTPRVYAIESPAGTVTSNGVYISKNPSTSSSDVEDQSNHDLILRSMTFTAGSAVPQGIRFGRIVGQKNIPGSAFGVPNNLNMAAISFETDFGYSYAGGENSRIAFSVTRNSSVVGENRLIINRQGHLIWMWDDALTTGTARDAALYPRDVTATTGSINGANMRIVGGRGNQATFFTGATNGGFVTIRGGEGKAQFFTPGRNGNVYLQSPVGGIDYSLDYGVFVCAPEGTNSPASLTIYPNTQGSGPFPIVYAGNTETLRVVDVAGTPRFTLNNAGEATSGLRFPGSMIATTDPYTLDRYAEGTWEPQIVGTTSHATYYSGGQWTRIGRKMHVSGWIRQDGPAVSPPSGLLLNHLPISTGSVPGLPDGVTGFMLNDARVGTWTEVLNESGGPGDEHRFFGSGNIVSFNANSSSVVNISTDQITISSGHGFTTGQYVTYLNGGGSSIGNLVSGSGYYVRVISPTVLSLCFSFSDATNPSAPVVNFTSLGTLGASLHSLECPRVKTGTVIHSYHNRNDGGPGPAGGGYTGFRLYFVGEGSYNPLALITGNRTVTFNLTWTFS